jgi:uncharacterized protein YejL (UPF0352 family)
MLHRIPRVILLMLLGNEHLNMIGTLFSTQQRRIKKKKLSYLLVSKDIAKNLIYRKRKHY